jgi:hypothetical protein
MESSSSAEGDSDTSSLRSPCHPLPQWLLVQVKLKQTCKHSPEESNWLLSPIKTPENQYQTLHSVSGVHILAADSVYTRIHHEKSKLTPWEEV